VTNERTYASHTRQNTRSVLSVLARSVDEQLLGLSNFDNIEEKARALLSLERFFLIIGRVARRISIGLLHLINLSEKLNLICFKSVRNVLGFVIDYYSIDFYTNHEFI